MTNKKRIPAFRSGDTIKVTLKIIEGDKSRLQAFEGVCIARKNNSVNSKFTLRKISHGEGVERVFSLFSPNLDSIEVIRKGDVRRAKLYYLRDRTGKKARIADRDRGNELDQYEYSDSVNNVTDKNPPEVQNEENKNESIENKEKEIEVSKEVEESIKNEKKSESSAKSAENTENESKS